MPGATMSLTGDTTDSTVTDGSGNYSFMEVSGGSYVVTPSKATLTPGSAGINTVDAIAEGPSTPTAYQEFEEHKRPSRGGVAAQADTSVAAGFAPVGGALGTSGTSVFVSSAMLPRFG